MKTQATFTPHQTDTWLAALSTFPTHLATRAILEAGLSTDPFPDCGKIIERILFLESQTTYAPGRKPGTLGTAAVQRIAAAMALAIDPD